MAELDRHNPWWSGKDDEGYKKWESIPYRWVPRIVEKVSLEPFSLNFVIGPRQVGKSTAMHILIYQQLSKRDPFSVFYYQCDELVDYRELGEILDQFLESKKSRKIKNGLIILDEITFVKDWWRAVKARIDGGDLKDDTLIITGSASIELLKEKERFPGRRGNGKDYFMYPLSFSEYAKIRGLNHSSGGLNKVEENMKKNAIISGQISTLFADYLKTGGFPRAIDNFLENGEIKQETKKTYLDWIIGDLIKANKSVKFSKEVFSYLLNVRATPISWLSISKNTSINAPHTSQSYVETFQDLLILKVLELIDPNNKIVSRKEKKIHLLDPFIYYILSEYAGVKILEETIVESTVAMHLARTGDVYYWRNGSEIDVILLRDKKQIGFEIKWGPKQWTKPRHLKDVYLLDKETLPLFLVSIDWEGTSI